MAADMLSPYARSIGITEADAHTARNIHLSVADCKHLRQLLNEVALESAQGRIALVEGALRWNQELSEYLKGAV